ncbi:MAG: hypothetical protein AAB131_00535 [Actinomycetota bacterium]|jgi:hypothetical protein
MDAPNCPTCPNCGKPITKVFDAPYGWWEWDADAGAYRTKTAASRVDVAPWVHADCMGELRRFHPQDPVSATGPGVHAATAS